MPGGDRTGPRGQGPMTGHRAGYCAGYNAPGYTHPASAPHLMGQFGGRGGGRGWRNRYYATGLPRWARPDFAPMTQDQELSGLKNAADWLKDQLDAISRRIDELEKK